MKRIRSKIVEEICWAIRYVVVINVQVIRENVQQILNVKHLYFVRIRVEIHHGVMETMMLFVSMELVHIMLVVMENINVLMVKMNIGV